MSLFVKAITEHECHPTIPASVFISTTETNFKCVIRRHPFGSFNEKNIFGIVNEKQYLTIR